MSNSDGIGEFRSAWAKLDAPGRVAVWGLICLLGGSLSEQQQPVLKKPEGENIQQKHRYRSG